MSIHSFDLLNICFDLPRTLSASINLVFKTVSKCTKNNIDTQYPIFSTLGSTIENTNAINSK